MALVVVSPAAHDVVACPDSANPGPASASNARRMANRPFMMQVDQFNPIFDGGGFDGGGFDGGGLEGDGPWPDGITGHPTARR